MYAYIGNSIGNGYRYVFDDSDGSVQFLKQEIIEQAGIEISEILPMEDKMNFGKMRLFGFDERIELNFSSRATYLGYNICTYKFSDDVYAILELIADHRCGGSCFVNFKFRRMVGDVLKYTVRYVGSAVAEYGIRWLDTATVEQIIPEKMVWYILNLKSKQDFDGIMDAFGGIFGSDIDRIASNIKGDDLQLLRWS